MLVKLFDERSLLQDLLDESLTLVHSTRTVRAIKLVLSIHDILELNLSILEKFKELDRAWADRSFAWWDISSLKHLNLTRCELVLFHRVEFKPLETIDTFNNKITKFINLADRGVGGKIAS